MTTATVIVVGGGPAGSTCAWELRQCGKTLLWYWHRYRERLSASRIVSERSLAPRGCLYYLRPEDERPRARYENSEHLRRHARGHPHLKGAHPEDGHPEAAGHLRADAAPLRNGNSFIVGGAADSGRRSLLSVEEIRRYSFPELLPSPRSLW